ncbi:MULTISPECIES: TetR/AcrR family transcriptional regulator [Undibacterium]|jgi:AcrR family transcriptional regulator|uniref:TetR/AcrR family transcriptional regulator n=1 Tax=Undibacterium umbellatum TaxID=2762300 RepID=A0ABR6Z5L7_9BURK|nr:MULTISPECIES: TetR/AcrR family transcriptional regulator [Undibacterium]MBC3907069.1 TetR/AcrR family transcriptional regulator [Undibacterium umbellatum]MDP1977431.1 TetR/AcrR family transcriptional regulator [Undibacterium sp.]
MLCHFKPKWERRKDARPQELLAAALDLFVERGFAATRLDDVARAAGVSKGTLYLYFCSKEELFKAVVRESIVPLIGEAEGVIDQFEGNSEELFRLIMTTWWGSIGNTKLSGLPKLMMAEAGNFPELAKFYQEEVINRGENLVMTMLKRGMARGEIRSVDVEIDSRILIAPMIMMMIWKHSQGVCNIEPEKLDTYLEHYIELALHSLLLKK